MKHLLWDAVKSDWLEQTRGRSFQEITDANLVRIRDNPNHPNQQMLLFEIEGYIWVVPFEEYAEALFLITAYPSRKYTRAYRNGQL